MTLARILGLGTALPEHRASQDQALALARRLAPYSGDLARTLPILYRRATVESRGVVLDPETGAPLIAADAENDPSTTAQRMRAFDEFAPPLAETAARRALENAQVEASAITHLVTVSCTGASAPGIDVALIDRLRLRRDVARAHLGFMGCYGALSGLRLASSLAREPDARVLLVAVELCSLHFHHGDDPQRIVANSLFSDGAGACVIGHTNDRAALAMSAFGSFLFPDSRDEMSWRIGEFGFEMALSPRVPKSIETHLRPFLEEWLAKAGVSLATIGSFAVHPGGPRILDAVERALDLGGDALATSRAVLAEHGNMSSPTVLFILERMLVKVAKRPMLALAFGPGLVAETTLFGFPEDRDE